MEALQYNMVQKRRFDDEEVYTVSCKHSRHVEHSNQMVSILEFVPSKYASHQLHTSGHDSFKKNKIEVDELFTSDGIPEIPTSIKKDIETSDLGCICDSSWATNSRSEADVKSEAPFENVLFSTEYCCPDRQIKTSSHSEENYSLCQEYPPRKPIPIGPDHQAIIPDIINNTDTSDPVTFLPQNRDDEKKLIGICVIPMPESELPVCSGEKVGNGRTDCSCQDAGSVRCTRQHITEEREKIKKSLGQKMFVDLGFYDMGEEVAEKWSEEEEDIFHRVVFSNPASLGNNFWDNLSIVFPSRTKIDIVSYYFNVFMLRKRAEQNRCNPMNIDSDDDEWQGSDEEDSVAMSPVYEDEHAYTRTREDDLHEYDETCDDYGNVDSGSGGGTIIAFETLRGNLPSYDPTFQLLNRNSLEEKRHNDIQEDSCSSSDTEGGSQETQKTTYSSDHWPVSFNGLYNRQEHGLEHCYSKGWDGGYMTCLKEKVDFLPTCSVIEEVFGNAAWNYNARDGKGSS